MNHSTILKNLKAVPTQYKCEHPSLSDGMLFSRFAVEMAFSSVLKNADSVPKDCYTDGPGDLQIDGLLIMMDGKIVTEIEDVKNSLVRKNGIGYISRIELFFLQSKFRDSFHLDDFNHFIAGVQNFILNMETPANINLKIQNWYYVWRYITREIAKTMGNKPKITVNLFIAFDGPDLENTSIEDQMKIFNQTLTLPQRHITDVCFRTFKTHELLSQYARRQQSGEGKHVHVTNVPRTQLAQTARCVSPMKVKQAMYLCQHDKNGYVFIAELGKKISVQGPLTAYLGKYPNYFELDPSLTKVREAARPFFCQHVQASPKPQSLGNFVNGRIISVDQTDWSGTVHAGRYGAIPFNFSDLMDPSQEQKLVSGNIARFEVVPWRNGSKVKSGTLLVL